MASARTFILLALIACALLTRTSEAGTDDDASAVLKGSGSAGAPGSDVSAGEINTELDPDSEAESEIVVLGH